MELKLSQNFKAEEHRKHLLQLINNKDNELDKAQIELADANMKLETAHETQADVSVMCVGDEFFNQFFVAQVYKYEQKFLNFFT